VKHWITVNEPGSFAIYGYDYGIEAPGRCSLMSRLFCKDGKSSTEPYIVAHNLLLAHAGAFHTYKQHFKVIHCKDIFKKSFIKYYGHLDALIAERTRRLHWNCT
jgi:beta-glucosidase/6-phospho-beta-glucosidase/beta-galactosidase